MQNDNKYILRINPLKNRRIQSRKLQPPQQLSTGDWRKLLKMQLKPLDGNDVKFGSRK